VKLLVSTQKPVDPSCPLRFAFVPDVESALVVLLTVPHCVVMPLSTVDMSV